MVITSETSMGHLLTEVTRRPDLTPLLEDLAYIGQIHVGHQRLSIRLMIKPDLSLTNPAELRTHFAAVYNEIIGRLEGSGVDFWSMPKLTIEGEAHGSSRNGRMDGGFYDDREFSGITGWVNIELYP